MNKKYILTIYLGKGERLEAHVDEDIKWIIDKIIEEKHRIKSVVWEVETKKE